MAEVSKNGGNNSVHIAGAGSSSLSSPTNALNDLSASDTVTRSTNEPKRFKSIGDNGFAAHFWGRVEIGPPNECWPWRLSLNGDGYGQIAVGGKNWTASRLAYVLAYGGIANGLFVCHSCDNKPCCNPSHLYAGTRSQNECDKHRRGSPATPKGERNHFSKLTEESVKHIRGLIRRDFTNVHIAQIIGVHHSTISAIRKGKTWKHV